VDAAERLKKAVGERKTACLHKSGKETRKWRQKSDLGEYLLIAQHRPHVTQFVKQGDGVWLNREFNDLADVVKLETLGCGLTLREVHQGVSFPPLPELPLFPSH
jgi:hypothetical protein